MHKIRDYVILIIVFILILAVVYYLMDYAMLIFNASIAILMFFLIGKSLYHFGPKKYTRKMKKVKPSEEAERIYKELRSVHGYEFIKLRIVNCICLFSGILIWVELFIARERKILEEYMVNIVLVLTYVIIRVVLRNQERLSKLYKEKILPDFIRLFPSGTAEYYQGKEYTTYETYRIDDAYRASGFNSEDYIDVDVMEGVKYSNEDTNIEIGNIWVSDKRQKRQDVIFSGLFAHANSTKSINYFIKISKNRLNKKKDKIDMDSSDFEEIFDIYSENKIYAMRILTSDVMMLLWDFYQKYELKFEVILSGNKIYLRFYTGNIFDVKLFGNSMNKKNLFIYYSIMDFVAELTKSINNALEDIEL